MWVEFKSVSFSLVLKNLNQLLTGYVNERNNDVETQEGELFITF